MSSLPIDAARDAFERAISAGPVVVAAPTGSGKSTQVPRWLRSRGRVLVVQPRRVACQSLATRVAALEGERLGEGVGYTVRDERRAAGNTEILFATTGVVLRMLRAGELKRFDYLVLDEFHERSLDGDLILALVLKRSPEKLVIMSATLAAEKVTRHLNATLVEVAVRSHDIRIDYVPDSVSSVQGLPRAPSRTGLLERLQVALDKASEDDGDVLVFLPGKAEISRAADAIAGRAGGRAKWEVHELYGDLPLARQAQIFSPGVGRRVILSTNVAETSLTIPGIGVVIDSGLVRRTHYRGGRGYLQLRPIAGDSATQRAGRAGRLGPGVCYRLWGPEIRLEASTPPEIRRESLVPLVLAAAACQAPDLALPFLDPPPEYAVDAARLVLSGLGAFDQAGDLSELGQALFGFPLDPHLGRALIEGKHRNTLDLVIPLCAALAVSRRFFLDAPKGRGGETPDRRGGNNGVGPGSKPPSPGCDAGALIAAVLWGQPQAHRIDPQALAEARRHCERLERLWPDRIRGDVARPPELVRSDQPLEIAPTARRALAETLLAAWPDGAHVARRRRGATAWSNGGTELELGRGSLVDPNEAEALIVLDTRAIGDDRGARGGRTTGKILITAAMPVPRAWLVAAGLGTERLAGSRLRRGQIVAEIERVFAGSVLSTTAMVPAGHMAREAIRDLVVRGILFSNTQSEIRERFDDFALWCQFAVQGGTQSEKGSEKGTTVGSSWKPPASKPQASTGRNLGAMAVGSTSFSEWLLGRLEQLGVEQVADLSLIEATDLYAPLVPSEVREVLDSRYPRVLSMGDANYRLSYDVSARIATLHQVSGGRKVPPPVDFLPRLPGWQIDWNWKNRVKTIRPRLT